MIAAMPTWELVWWMILATIGVIGFIAVLANLGK